MKYVEIVKKEQFAFLVLSRGKANPMNHQMILAIRKALREISDSSDIRGIILTGNTPGYFSVGLDLVELFSYDESEISAFWEDWEAMIMELVTFTKPMIAAVNGYSPAGGCVLAITADYRIMADDARYVIGLNEVAVGIAIPVYIFQMFSFWSGPRTAYHSLLAARLFQPAEALDVGLVDELHALEGLSDRAEAKMRSWLQSPDTILHHSKKHMRAGLVDQLRSNPQVGVEERLRSWFDPSSRSIMNKLVEELNAKKKRNK